MRIALVSDSHIRDGRPALPERLVAALRRADLILHAGDVVDETGLAAFRRIGPDVVAVSGNMDRRPLVAELPELRRVDTEAGTIAVLHVLPRIRGGPRAVIEQYLGEADRPLAVVHGHTHRPEIRSADLDDGRRAWVINPGTVLRNRGWGRSYAWLETDGDTSHAWLEELD